MTKNTEKMKSADIKNNSWQSLVWNVIKFFAAYQKNHNNSLRSYRGRKCAFIASFITKRSRIISSTGLN